MDSGSIIKLLQKYGWELKRVTGSHHHYINIDTNNLITVPHPKKDIPIGTLKSIEKHSGIKFDKRG